MPTNRKFSSWTSAFGALDAQIRKYMLGELVKIWEKFHETIMFVTHSVVEAAFLSDAVVVMTACPGRARGVFDTAFSRARDYTGDHFISFRKEILGCLEEEVKKEIDMDRP